MEGNPAGMGTGPESQRATPIQPHDPAFSEETFLSFARAVTARLSRACGACDLEPVRRVLGPDYLEHLQAICQTPSDAEITITSAYLVSAETRGDRDTAVVRVHYARDQKLFIVDDTFQRPATATSRVEDQRECPVCGAPLSLDEQGICRYCGTPVLGGMGGWRLVGEEDTYSPTEPPSPGSPVDAPIGAHDPAFDGQAFVSFAVAVSLRVIRAETAGNLPDVQRLLAPTYFNELRAAKERPTFPEMRVLDARLQRAGTHAGWDTALVRVTVCHDVPRPPYSWMFDSIFQRPATGTSRAGDQQGCPVCGAPVSLDEQGACRYCGAPVVGGMGGWQLTEIDWAVTVFPVGRWFSWGQTAGQVDALLRQRGARPTQVRVEDPSVPSFAVSMVENAGAYASAWCWPRAGGWSASIPTGPPPASGSRASRCRTPGGSTAAGRGTTASTSSGSPPPSRPRTPGRRWRCDRTWTAGGGSSR
jgi:predicted lipid-binding transport protein (Tim44 family)/predicted nucleic acid-binding Zn ribbon protein